jgi:hypothetical protein
MSKLSISKKDGKQRFDDFLGNFEWRLERVVFMI